MADVSLVDLQNAAPHAAEAAAKVERSAQQMAANSQAAQQKQVQEKKLSPVQELQQKELDEKSLSEKQRDALKDAFRDLNSVMNHFSRSIRFAVFEQSGDMYAQVINTNTEEVVKTIPSKEALQMMSRVHDVLGMILDEEG